MKKWIRIPAEPDPVFDARIVVGTLLSFNENGEHPFVVGSVRPYPLVTVGPIVVVRANDGCSHEWGLHIVGKNGCYAFLDTKFMYCPKEVSNVASA